MEWIITQLNILGEAFVRLALSMLITSTALTGLVLLVEFVALGGNVIYSYTLE